jgi:hypothetical protein
MLDPFGFLMAALFVVWATAVTMLGAPGDE